MLRVCRYDDQVPSLDILISSIYSGLGRARGEGEHLVNRVFLHAYQQRL